MRQVWVPVALVACLAASCGGLGESDTIPPSAPSQPTSTMPETTSPPMSATTTEVRTSTSDAAAEPSLVMLAPGPDSTGPISGVANRDGHLRVAYVSSDGSLHLVKCSDPLCEDPIADRILGQPGELLEIDLALHPDGSPVVVAQPWSSSVASVYVCLDPDCTSVEVSELGDPEPCVYPDGNPCEFSVDFPSLVIDADGRPRVIYQTNTNPRIVRVATCETSLCADWAWETVDQHPPDTASGAPSVRLASNGQLVVAYWFSDPSTGATTTRIAVCGDPSCSDPAQVSTIEGAVHPQSTLAPDGGGFLVWHQTGSEGLPIEAVDPDANFALLWSDYSDLQVSACTADGCGDADYVEVGEDWLLANATQALRVFTAADGTTSAFFNHASLSEAAPQLHVTTCEDSACSDGVTAATGFETIDGPFFDVISGPGGPPRVVFVSTEGAVQLLACSTRNCATAP